MRVRVKMRKLRDYNINAKMAPKLANKQNYKIPFESTLFVIQIIFLIVVIFSTNLLSTISASQIAKIRGSNKQTEVAVGRGGQLEVELVTPTPSELISPSRSQAEAASLPVDQLNGVRQAGEGSAVTGSDTSPNLGRRRGGRALPEPQPARSLPSPDYWRLQMMASDFSTTTTTSSSSPSPTRLQVINNMAALKFALEPPALVEFSNSTGTVIPCQAAQVVQQQIDSANKNINGGLKVPPLATPTSVTWRRLQSQQQHQHKQQSQTGQEMDPIVDSIDSDSMSPSLEELVPSANAQDGTSKTTDSGVFVRRDGALVIEAFNGNSRQQANYRCCLENRFGSLCSRPVRTRAVIDSSFQAEVFDVFALENNVAALKCQLPGHLSRHVEYLAWLKDDKLLITSTSAQVGHSSNLRTTGSGSWRPIRQHKQQGDKLKYIIIPTTGELYIRNVSKPLDQGAYKCRVRHRLTNQIITSKLAGQLIIDDSRSKVPLKTIDLNQGKPFIKSLWVREGGEAILCADFQSSPPPTFRWFYNSDKAQLADLTLNGNNQVFNNVKQLDSCLIISYVQARQAGEYLCEASSMSDSSSASPATIQRASFQLQVSSSQLSVQLTSTTILTNQKQEQTNSRSPIQIIPFASSVHLNCSINGWPFDTIVWLKDSKLIAKTILTQNQSHNSDAQQQHQNVIQSNKLTDNNIKLLPPNVLSLESFSLKSRGVYQCQAYSSSRLGYLASSNGSFNDFSMNNLNQQQADIDNDLTRSASASIQLELLYSKPILGQKFPSNPTVIYARPDTPISLQCSAFGLPTPRILWFLDNQPILGSSLPSYQLEGSESTEGSSTSMVPEESEWNFSLDQGESFMLDGPLGRYAHRDRHSNIDAGSEFIVDPRFQISTIQQQQQQQVTRGIESMTTTSESLIGPLISSQLNISQPRATETGQFKCVAVNSLGHAHHSGNLIVIATDADITTTSGSSNGAAGAPSITTTKTSQPFNSKLSLRNYQPKNITLIAGRSGLLQCPLVGFPLARVDWWFKGDRKGEVEHLPQNHRQRIEPIRLGLGGQLELSKLDKLTDSGVYTCRASIATPRHHPKNLPTNSTSEPSQSSSSLSYLNYFLSPLTNTMSANLEQQISDSGSLNEELVGQIRVNVKVAPMIDSQSLPEVVQANEGMRTKLVCSVVQGDHPVKIKWLKRIQNSAYMSQQKNLAGFQLLQSSTNLDTNDEESDLVTIHNLEDSCLLTFKRVSYQDSGEYLCLAQNEVGFVTRFTRLVINVAPTWSVEPHSEVRVLLNSELRLDCSAYGYPSPMATWKREISSQITDSTSTSTSTSILSDKQKDYFDLISNYRQRAYLNGTLIIEQVEQSDGGVYMCELTNGIGGGLSRLIRVIVNTPPHFKHRTSSHLSQLSGKAELKCLVYGDQPMLIGWQKEINEQIDLVNDSRHRIINEHKPTSQVLESSLKIENLQRNDSGYYYCIGSNEFGIDEMRIQLIVQEPPEAPSLMRPIRASSRQATLSFKLPYSGNSPIKKYSISFRQLQYDSPSSPSLYQDSLDSNWQQIILDNPSSSSMALDQEFSNSSFEISSGDNQLVHLNLCCLQPFTKYLVQVRAINDIGPSEPSKPVQLLTDEEAIGGPPLEVSVEPTGAHSLKVRWQPPARNLQNGLIRGYYIGYRASGPLTNAAPSSPSGSSTLSPTILQQSSNVKIFESSESEQYQYKNVQLLDSITNNSINLLPSSNNRSSSTVASQVFTSYLTNLRRKTAYSIIVQAYNKIGAGPRSDQIIVSTLDAAPPMTPILKLVSVTYNSASLIWQARRFNMQTSTTKLVGSLYSSGAGENKDSNITFRGSAFKFNRFFPLPGAASGSQEGDLEDFSNELGEDDDNDPQSFYTINFKLDDKQATQQQQLTSSVLSTPTIPSSQTAPLSPNTNQASQSNGNSIVDDWHQRRLQRRQQLPYVLNNLRCGSRYQAYITATNSLGQSEPGQSIRFSTLGGAPIAPASSRHFLQVNSSFVLLKLGAWLNSGCIISSFTIKYKSLSQAKWTILEHQVHPTIQTVTISGSAVFSTRTGSNLQQLEFGPFSSDNEIIERNSVGILENARRVQQYNNNQVSISGSGDTIAMLPQRQVMNDFIIRNLFAGTNYRLIVEANSEAGSTIAEYEFETGNFSTTTISISVNGNIELSPSELDQLSLINPNNRLKNAQVGFEFNAEGNPLAQDIDFAYGNNQQRFGASGRLPSNMSLWSMSALLVIGSIVMIITTIILGVRSFFRIKSSPGSLSTNSRDSLISQMFSCCSSGSSSRSSTGADDSSHSSSAGCYQTSNNNHYHHHHNHLQQPSNCVQSVYGVCQNQPNSLGISVKRGDSPPTLGAATISGNHLSLRNEEETNELKSILGGSLPFRQLVNSSSLSTIHQRYNNNINNARYLSNTLTLNRHLNTAEDSLQLEAPIGSHPADHISAHYAATLGKQLNHHRTFMQQPAKFANSPSLYGRLNQQDHVGCQQTFQNPLSSSGGTSGYESSQRGADSDISAECQQQLYIQNNLQNQSDMYPMNLFACNSNNQASSASASSSSQQANNQQTVAESNLFDQQQQQQQQFDPELAKSQFLYNIPTDNLSDSNELAKQLAAAVCRQQQQQHQNQHQQLVTAAEQLSSSAAYGVIKRVT